MPLFSRCGASELERGSSGVGVGVQAVAAERSGFKRHLRPINQVDLRQFLSITVPQLNKDTKPEPWGCWAE